MRLKRSPATTIAVGGVLAFLLATNPLVAEAAGMITGRDIKDGTVTTKDVKNKTLQLGDLSLGARNALQDGLIGSPCRVPPDDLTGAVQYTVEDDGTLTLSCERVPSTADADGDGFSEATGDCNDANPSVHPDAPEVVGDEVDNDCDGVVDDDYDGDGWGVTEGDCNDADPEVYPGAIEYRDDYKDNDCDGLIDEE